MDVLSRKNLPPIIDGQPVSALFALPEKVIQFGTGVLLRALPDYFIDRANKKGLFNGRIVMVKSTEVGSITAFQQQDGLYTHLIRGFINGKEESSVVINTAISRVLTAKHDWPAVLSCATQPELSIVVSNTTEVGLTYTEESILTGIPESFPGKLLAFLYRRYTFFQGAYSKGMVIIPTELIPDNGALLRTYLITLSQYNQLPTPFLDWLLGANSFCNSLVDRIVPGKLPQAEQGLLEQQLGYRDDLMIQSESFRLWAIETDQPRVRELLSFSEADEGIVLTEQLYPYRELKLRLLNGTHTFACGLAFLAGFTTVRDAMANPHFERYIRQLMLHDIVPCIVEERISETAALAFAHQTLDRFRNPYLAHQWLNITLQYTSKMKMRNLPLLIRAGKCFESVPETMCLGFAAYLLFMKCQEGEGAGYFGAVGHRSYLIRDDNARYFAKQWATQPLSQVAEAIMKDTACWGFDLSRLPGFLQRVNTKLQELLSSGALTVLEQSSYS